MLRGSEVLSGRFRLWKWNTALVNRNNILSVLLPECSKLIALDEFAKGGLGKTGEPYSDFRRR